MISKQQQKILKSLQSRHGRKKSDFFVAEGWRCCEEALRRRPEWLEALFYSQTAQQSPQWPAMAALATAAGVEPLLLPDKDFAGLADTVNSQGLLCLLKRVPCAAPRALPDPFCLILDRISEPGNLGTILRTAWALGLRSVWLIKGSADAHAPKVVRAGMGAQFALELPVFEDLPAAAAKLQELGGKKLWCALPAAGTTLFADSFALRGSGLVIGNEANGISHPELGQAVTIPMPGQAESLNAAQAATVFLFEALRRGLFTASC
jgi:TrmH family RNA methyltransferase